MRQSFVMLIGPAGSGKSTVASYAKRAFGNSKGEALVLSSDTIREEVYGDANDQRNPGCIFGILNQRTYDAIATGRSVIYDATNLVRERRIEMINKIRSIKPNCACIAVCFNTSVEECIRRQSLRDRKVPDFVIEKQWHMMHTQMPTREEGWNRICFSDQA